jgi:hypothetical protein
VLVFFGALDIAAEYALILCRPCIVNYQAAAFEI